MAGIRWQVGVAVTSFAAVVAVGACGGRDETTTDSINVATGTVAPTDTAARAAAPATAPAATGSGNAMSITGGDPEIVQFLATVDLSEIAAGRAAQRQARNPQVRSFGRTLVTEHTQSLRRDRALAKAANVTIDTSVIARDTGAAASAAGAPVGTSAAVTQLATTHKQTMERLRGLQGADFDSAFMNAQVTGHQQVLDVLQRAQTQAQDSSVRQHLTTATEGVQKHLDRARELQQSVMSGGTGTGTGTKTGDTAAKARPDTGRRP